jgi:PAS domain S-box-containing protein
MHKAVHYAHADGSDYAEADCAMAAAFHDGEVRQISDEVLWRKDGTAFPVEYSATPISSDEELVGAVVVFRDITERQLAEAKLNASMQRFKVLFDEAADAYLIFDGTGFADCNQAAVDLLGYSHKQELLACHPAEFSPELQPGGERSDEKAEAMIAAAYSQGGNRFDWIHRKKGGEEIPVEVTLTPIELDGKPVLLTVWHDLTERQKAEEEIKRINFLSDIALELTGSGYWHVDYSDPDYYYQSERAANILGEPLKDDSRYHLQDEWFSRLMEANPKTAETTAERYQGAIDGKYTSYDSTYAYRRPLDGKIVWVHAAGKIVRDESDKIRYMYGAYQDITEPHRVQRELNVAKEAADAANQAKSAFLANMSHELRTPMNAILGYSEMLMEDAEDAEQDEFIPDLKKINQAGNHLLSLINDVLDLSKIESGKMEAFAEQFDVGALIDQAFDTAQPLMEKKNNHFKIERGDNLGYAYQDITKLRQSLLNMLSNAAKFTHAGTITLWAERKSHANADWLTFSVSDTGIGIPADKLDHVFEEFSQADTSTTRDYGGTGLGLAISRRFCQMLGGDLTVASQVGAGSTFTIQLPAVLPGAEAPQEEAPQPNTEDVKASSDVNEAPSGRTILVIDDDAEASEIIRRFLEKDGYNVVTAISGEAGLRLAHQLKPAAITLDVMMPDMDGWSVLRALKVDPVLQDIPVVMLSMIDDKSKGFALGATDYLTKPVDREQLHNALARHYTPGEPSSVLLVEDDQPTREMMARTLEKTDWDVSEAGNGREALEQLARQKPRLILLDLMMPVMDGFDFLLEMRAKAEWQDIPVIVLTAKDLSGEDRRVLSGRVEQIVEKVACSNDQVVNLIRQVLVHHAQPAAKLCPPS